MFRSPFADGQVYIGSGIEAGSVGALSASTEGPGATEPLTDREQEVLKLLAVSSRSKDIAEKLNISVRTVEKHRGQIMKKLGIDNVAGLTRYALMNENTGFSKAH